MVRQNDSMVSKLKKFGTHCNNNNSIKKPP